MEASPPFEHFVDEADHLLAPNELFHISFLQRKFRIGYISAQRLYQLVLERRSGMIDYRNAITTAWERAMSHYTQGKVNSECTLHSFLYSKLMDELPDCTVLCEPQLNLDRHGIFIPDIVVLKDNQIVMVVEVKFVPGGYPVFEMDIAKLQTIGLNEEGPGHRLLLDPETGKLLKSTASISDECILCFAVIGRSDARAVCLEDLQAALTSGGRSHLLTRFLPLVKTTPAAASDSGSGLD